MALAEVSLDDKCTLDEGRVVLTAIQALVRLPFVQRKGAVVLALGFALTLAACAAPSAWSPEDIVNASASVKTAVGDAEEAAWRARTYNSANIWVRAAHEVEEAEVPAQSA